MEAVYVRGISDLAETDIRYALDLGYRIKMLAVIKQSGGAVEVRVHPTLVPLGHMLASVSGVFNAVMVRSDLLGETLYYGKGAGREPTASTVIGDIGDVACNIGSGPARHSEPVPRFGVSEFRRIDEISTRYYLRMSVLDKPGALAKIARCLGKYNVSIASVLQKEMDTGSFVPVVLVTHAATSRDVTAALSEIDSDEVVDSPTVKLIIEG
jgi:homoserine dehydrogenase